MLGVGVTKQRPNQGLGITIFSVISLRWYLRGPYTNRLDICTSLGPLAVQGRRVPPAMYHVPG